MNSNVNNHSKGMNGGDRAMEPKEAKALDISVIRARESRRIRRTNIDWFSL